MFEMVSIAVPTVVVGSSNLTANRLPSFTMLLDSPVILSTMRDAAMR